VNAQNKKYMFEKLLANLPYNPGLTKQFGFYARRLRHEESIRRTGMIFTVLAFLVQFFAFISPPQPTTAYSSSDMINGGISSKADAVRACRDNAKNFGDVMWNFKITCNDIAQSSLTTVRSTDYNGRLFSMSWLPYGQTNPHSGKPTDETPYNLPKISETIYARRLTSADTIPFSTYNVLKGTASNGQMFYIMLDCGNLMFVGVPNPVDICRRDGQVYYKGSSECLPKTLEEKPICPWNSNIPKDSPRCKKPEKPEKPCEFNAALPANSPECFKPCPYNQNVPKDSPQCKPCEDAGSANPVACVVERKSATNVTQNIADAHNTTAQPNDVIVYTLYAENKGKETVKDFVVQENLSDVLDYANVVNLHGGKLADTGMVTWPKADIKPGSTLTQKITVRVKNPLPTDTPPAGDPNHFDYVMTNVYGNSIHIDLPKPQVVTPVASASQELPHTGPGTGLMIAGAIVVLGGYFFARTRLLVDESMITIQETTGGRL
jgi:hypothetical protein